MQSFSVYGPYRPFQPLMPATHPEHTFISLLFQALYSCSLCLECPFSLPTWQMFACSLLFMTAPRNSTCDKASQQQLRWDTFQWYLGQWERMSENWSTKGHSMAAATDRLVWGHILAPRSNWENWKSEDDTRIYGEHSKSSELLYFGCCY